jgi:hypothetical protein
LKCGNAYDSYRGASNARLNQRTEP